MCKHMKKTKQIWHRLQASPSKEYVNIQWLHFRRSEQKQQKKGGGKSYHLLSDEYGLDPILAYLQQLTQSSQDPLRVFTLNLLLILTFDRWVAWGTEKLSTLKSQS